MTRSWDPSRLAALRTEYARVGLDELSAGDDPLELFARWLDEAVQARVPEANAMALATASADGMPSVRIVLLKALDERGATFFTHYTSRKGQDLQENPRAAATLLWHPIQRQVRLEGPVEQVSAAESDAYFASRPRGAQLGAVASAQSREITDRAALESAMSAAADRAGDGPVERPASWGGYRLVPDVIEFWHGRENRLHDRLEYRRHGDTWVRRRLQP